MAVSLTVFYAQPQPTPRTTSEALAAASKALTKQPASSFGDCRQHQCLSIVCLQRPSFSNLLAAAQVCLQWAEVRYIVVLSLENADSIHHRFAKSISTKDFEYYCDSIATRPRLEYSDIYRCSNVLKRLSSSLLMRTPSWMRETLPRVLSKGLDTRPERYIC